jgi:ABC-2 type transport system permease protein
MSLQRILGVFYRYFYVLKKGPQQLSDLFYWPLIDILLWGLTSIWIQTLQPSSDISQVLLTGLIFGQVTWRGSVDIAVSVLQEFWHRNLVNLFTTPLKVAEWLIGIILFSLCKLIATLSFGWAMVYLLYSVNVFSHGWAFIPYTISLIIFGWTLGLLAASFIVYWGQHIEAVAWMIGYIFSPFSAIFYPVSVLPEWAQKISWCIPSTYIFESIRAIYNGAPFPHSYYWSSMGINLVCFPLAIFLFKYSFEKSREKGLARLE